jgi:hypothetical protein
MAGYKVLFIRELTGVAYLNQIMIWQGIFKTKKIILGANLTLRLGTCI